MSLRLCFSLMPPSMMYRESALTPARFANAEYKVTASGMAILSSAAATMTIAVNFLSLDSFYEALTAPIQRPGLHARNQPGSISCASSACGAIQIQGFWFPIPHTQATGKFFLQPQGFEAFPDPALTKASAQLTRTYGSPVPGAQDQRL